MDLRDVSYARDLFTELVVAWSMRGAGPPDESKTNELAEEAMQMAKVMRAAQTETQTAVVADRPSARLTGSSPTFAEVAADWMDRIVKRSASNSRQWLVSRFRRYVIPHLGSRLIGDVKPGEILAVIKSIESAGHAAMAYMTFKDLRFLYRYALAAGLTDQDPTATLRRAINRPAHKGMAMVLDQKSIGHLLVAIRDYKGQKQSAARYLLRLAPTVFLRPSELRTLEWQNVDLDAATIVVPAAAMKNRRPHIVPLARQAVRILRDVHKMTGYGQYVFTSGRNGDKPLDYSIYFVMLKAVGFGRRVTAHGFRTLAATWLSEQGWREEAISRQLSHLGSDRTRRIYNRAEYLPERTAMMQAWADNLEAVEHKARSDGGSHASD